MKTPSLYIFDCGGVLFSEKIWQEFFASLGRDGVRSIRSLGPRSNEAVEAFTRGDISEKAFWDEISIDFGSPIPWRDGLAGRFYQTAFIPGVAEVIRDLRGAGRRVVAGSNLIPCFLEVNRANHRYDVFDKAYISCEMHLAKPDAAFYREILRKEGRTPEEAFFTDDLEKNVDAARAVGLDAFRFTDADALRKRLTALGAFLQEEDCG